MASVTFFFFFFLLPSRRKPTYSLWGSVLYVSFKRILGLRTPLGVLNALWGYFIPWSQAMEIMMTCHSHLQRKGCSFTRSHYYQKGYAIYNLIAGWGPQTLSAFKNSPGAKGMCHLWPDFQEWKWGSHFQRLESLQMGHYPISLPVSGEVGVWYCLGYVTLMDFPGPLSPLPSESLCCLRTYPELGSKRKKGSFSLFSDSFPDPWFCTLPFSSQMMPSPAFNTGGFVHLHWRGITVEGGWGRHHLEPRAEKFLNKEAY